MTTHPRTEALTKIEAARALIEEACLLLAPNGAAPESLRDLACARSSLSLTLTRESPPAASRFAFWAVAFWCGLGLLAGDIAEAAAGKIHGAPAAALSAILCAAGIMLTLGIYYAVQRWGGRALSKNAGWGPKPPYWKEAWPPGGEPPPWHEPYRAPPWSRSDWFGCLTGWASGVWLCLGLALWAGAWLRGRDLSDPKWAAPVMMGTFLCLAGWAVTLFILKLILNPDNN
jgi:hypothetical protein